MTITASYDWSTLTDEELVLHGYSSTDAFAEIMNRYEKKLLRYVARIANFHPQENEEIVQEIFLKCWQNLRGFSVKLKFSSWIYRIAHNTTIDHYRKQKKQTTISIDSAQLEITSDEVAHFDQSFDTQINREQIQTVLENMPGSEREILVLFFLEEKNYAEIMDILQISKSRVANRLARAKKKFESTAFSLAIIF